MKIRAVIAAACCLTAPVLVAQRPTSVDYAEIDKHINALFREPWPGAENRCSPMCWDFHFTPPMKALLDVGPEAQAKLLPMISAVAIRDQVIILLGGVGDEEAIGPIISAMQSASSEPPSEQRKRTLTAGSLALTNITVAEVIWHRGGGIPHDACPDDPAGCWSAWWERNQATFRVKDIKVSRRYVNYPNYGIYHGLP